MFRQDHRDQQKQSFEDVLLSDSLSDYNAAPLAAIGTEFDLDLDQLTSPVLDIPDSDWDVMAQSDSVFNPMLGSNSKPSHISFLQLSPPALQFETLPDTKFAAISTETLPVQQLNRSPSFFQSSGFHQQQVSAVPLPGTLYRPETQAGVVQAKLVSNEYGLAKASSHYDVAAASNGGLPAPPSAASSNDKEQQDHIVNALSVSQMLAVAAAYDQVCQVEDLDIGCANWLASSPDASEVEIRAVRALFNPDRWNFAKDIVMRIVKIVDDLRSAVSEIPASKASKHLIGRAKKRTSPKFMFNSMKLPMDVQQMMDENAKKRRI